MTSTTGLFQLFLSSLLSRSAMGFFLLLCLCCAVLFFKCRGRSVLRMVSGLLALVCLVYGVFILFLVFAFGHSDGRLTERSGEVVEWSTDGDTVLSSFVVQTEEGDRFGVLMTGQTVVLPSDTLSAEDFLRQPPEGVVVSVLGKKGRQTLTAQDGRTLAAFSCGSDLHHRPSDAECLCSVRRDGGRPDTIRRCPLRLQHLPSAGREAAAAGAPALRPGKRVRRRGGELRRSHPAAQEAVSAYYDRRGLLYDIKQQVEAAYQAYRTDPDSPPFHVEQSISPSAASSRVLYFLTSVTMPGGNGSGKELRLGDAFDRETGARLPPLTLFSLPPEQVPEALVSLSKPESDTLHTEMLAAFRPEYLVFFPEHLELNFPRGTLPSQEYDYIAALDYTSQLTALLQSWAIPLDN